MPPGMLRTTLHPPRRKDAKSSNEMALGLDFVRRIDRQCAKALDFLSGLCLGLCLTLGGCLDWMFVKYPG
jgi:hypothetical protein